MSVRPEAASIVFREPIFTVPLEILASHSHSFDKLTQMGVGLQQHERGLSGENNGVSSMSVGTAAVLDVSVSIIYAVWKLPSVPVAVS